MEDEKSARIAYIRRTFGPFLEAHGSDDEAISRFVEWRANELPANWRDQVARREAEAEAFAQLKSFGVKECFTGDAGEEKRLLPHLTRADYMGRATSLRFGAFLGWQGSSASTTWCLDGIRKMTGKQRNAANFHSLNHQAGGHCCLQIPLLAAPLVLSASGIATAAALSSHYFHYHSGHFYHSSPEDVEAYRDRLGTWSLTAKDVLSPEGEHGIVESVYPLDASLENLELLADGQASLEPLASVLKNSDARARLAIIILAENSD